MTPYDLANRFVGIKEIPGSIHDPTISWMLAMASNGNIVSDETAWCSAFVWNISWLFGLERHEWPNSVRARHWLSLGEKIDLIDAQRGYDIVILSRGSGAQPGPQVLNAPGHVGFFSMWNGDDYIDILGGNQSDMVCRSKYKINKILGIRRLRKYGI